MIVGLDLVKDSRGVAQRCNVSDGLEMDQMRRCTGACRSRPLRLQIRQWTAKLKLIERRHARS